MITYHQMTLAEIFTETQEIFESDKPEFLKLLESTIDLSELIPVSFRNHFYASTGRPREYSFSVHKMDEAFIKTIFCFFHFAISIKVSPASR